MVVQVNYLESSKKQCIKDQPEKTPVFNFNDNFFSISFFTIYIRSFIILFNFIKIEKFFFQWRGLRQINKFKALYCILFDLLAFL